MEWGCGDSLKLSIDLKMVVKQMRCSFKSRKENRLEMITHAANKRFLYRERNN
jgi:hypothetical protein